MAAKMEKCRSLITQAPGTEGTTLIAPGMSRPLLLKTMQAHRQYLEPSATHNHAVANLLTVVKPAYAFAGVPSAVMIP
mgnify:CR=1